MSCRPVPSSRPAMKILFRLPKGDPGPPGAVNFSNTMRFPSGDQSGFPTYVGLHEFLETGAVPVDTGYRPKGDVQQKPCPIRRPDGSRIIVFDKAPAMSNCSE